MLRALILVSLMFATAPCYGAPAQAGPIAHLDQPNQTIDAAHDGIGVLAFFHSRASTLELTVLVTDTDGDVLRTRVGMRDQQHHRLTVPGGEDGASTTFHFLRVGQRIILSVEEPAMATDYAARAPAHF